MRLTHLVLALALLSPATALAQNVPTFPTPSPRRAPSGTGSTCSSRG